MKKSLLILVLVLVGITQLIAQAPQAFNYQAIARDKAGNILSNQQVSIKIGILQGDVDGPAVYQETHTATTNEFGLINLSIGDGQRTTDGGSYELEGLSVVNWSQGPYFIKVEMDENGGSNYREMGTAELLSVPYALYAEKAGIGGSRAGEWDNDGTDVYVHSTYAANNVGIGITGPEGKLHVYGTGYPTPAAPMLFIEHTDGFSSTFKRVHNHWSSNSLFLLQRARGSLGSESAVFDGDRVGQIRFEGYHGAGGSGYGYPGIIICQVDGALSGTTVPGNLQFWTTNTSGSLAEHMRISSSGKVGIGTVDPAFRKLSIDGGGLVGIHVLNNDPGSATVCAINEGGGPVGYFYGGDFIILNGNVGIENDTPGYPLDVTGTVNASNYYKNGSEFNEGKWSENGNEIYYNSGNVGIGTSDPGYDLDVIDDGSSWIRVKSSTSFAGIIIDKGNESDNGYIQYRTAGDAQWFVGMIDDNNFSISKTHVSSDGSFYIDQNSNVGIGCTNPDEELVVGTPLGSGWAIPAITIGGSSGGGIEMGSTTYNLKLSSSSTMGRAMIISSDAGGHGDGNIEFMCNNVGIGSGAPAQHLEVYGSGNQYARITSSNHSIAGLELIRSGAGYYDWKIENSLNDLYFKFDANEFASTSTTAMWYDQSDNSLNFFKNDGTKTIEIDADYGGDGRIITNELQITGGADIAEPFDISSQEDIKSGMVVSIDKDSPGKLKVAVIKYDRCVAGIISGAGNIKTGLFLQDKDTEADGEYPVALTGRVYCWADATHGAIEPGDLLTTSATPGHAMKVTDYGKAQGAILGKAMSGLEEGKGLVFVLVTLQ